MAATLDRISDGRLLINVVTGGDPVELKGDGLFLDHAARYARHRRVPARLARAAGRARPSTHEGEHLRLEGGQLFFPPVQQPYPPLVVRRLVGRRHRDRGRAGRHLPDLGRAARRRGGEDRAGTRWRAAARGRTLRFGIRLHVIVRETAAEAWAAADRLIAHVDDESVAKAQAVFARMDSVGQQRMSRLHGGRRDQLEISPNLWAGVGLVRGGAGTALVGDPETVAARMQEYMALGIDAFILSGYPHLEECYRFAELVFPLLPLKATTGRPRRTVRNAGPFGEIIANEVMPGPPGAGGVVRPRARRRPVPWLLPVALVAGLGGWPPRRGWLSARVLPAPSATALAFWDTLRSGALAAPCLGQHPARADRPRHRRRPGLRARPAQRRVPVRRAAARFLAADAAQHPAPGGDPAGDPLVRHRRGGQAVPGRGRRPVPDLPQHLPRHPPCRPRR